MLRFQNMPIYLYVDSEPFINSYSSPVTNVTIQTQNALQPARILHGRRHDDMRIGGSPNTKINLNFLACTANTQEANYRMAEVILTTLTGDKGAAISLGGGESYEKCFLEEVTVSLSPLNPVAISASFACLEPPTGQPIVEYQPFTGSLVDYLVHSYDTYIDGGSAISDSNRESITYKVSCGRTYSTPLGQIVPQTGFLDSLEKEINIKAINISNWTDYDGTSAPITVIPQDSLGNDLVAGGFGLSSNGKIVSQSVSLGEGDVLRADITAKEVIL